MTILGVERMLACSSFCPGSLNTLLKGTWHFKVREITQTHPIAMGSGHGWQGLLWCCYWMSLNKHGFTSHFWNVPSLCLGWELTTKSKSPCRKERHSWDPSNDRTLEETRAGFPHRARLAVHLAPSVTSTQCSTPDSHNQYFSLNPQLFPETQELLARIPAFNVGESLSHSPVCGRFPDSGHGSRYRSLEVKQLHDLKTFPV